MSKTRLMTLCTMVSRAFSLLVICGPFFRQFKFAGKEADLRDDVTAQLESKMLETGTYVRENDGKWTLDDSMLLVGMGRHLRRCWDF